MKLLIGLGNPGAQYEKTPHNAGFLAVEEIKKQQTENSEWKFEKRFLADVAEGVIEGEKIILAKPQTFMNKSGEAVAKLARFYRIKPADVWVLHDELDLPFGTLRMKIGGGAAGHKGVASIISAIKSDFVRFRIGIAPVKRIQPAEEFVLKKFSTAELRKLKSVIAKIPDIIAAAIAEGVEKAMSIYHT